MIFLGVALVEDRGGERACRDKRAVDPAAPPMLLLLLLLLPVKPTGLAAAEICYTYRSEHPRRAHAPRVGTIERFVHRPRPFASKKKKEKPLCVHALLVLLVPKQAPAWIRISTTLFHLLLPLCAPVFLALTWVAADEAEHDCFLLAPLEAIHRPHLYPRVFWA